MVVLERALGYLSWYVQLPSYILIIDYTLFYHRMCLPRSSGCLALTHSACLLSISCMSANWALGKHYSRTSSGCFIPSLGVARLSRPLTRGTRSSYELVLSQCTSGKSLIQSYCRFRQIPTFGNGIICRFSNNTSEMKQLAVRDFEDILQVCELCVSVYDSLECS